MTHTTALLLRGLPGTGKTTTAALMRDLLSPAVRVSDDSVRYMARPRDFTSFTLEASERACLDLALSYCDSGFNPIIDGVFEDTELLQSQVLQFQRRGHNLVVISLIADKADLIARNNSRDPFQRMEEGRLTELHEQFVPEGHPIGIRGKMPEEVCDDILDVLDESGLTRTDQVASPDEVDVLFLRHGLPEYPGDTYPDHVAMPLSAVGRAEALAVRAAVRRFRPDVVISSDFARAKETAELATRRTGLSITTTQALRERVFLGFAGRSHCELISAHGQDMHQVLAGNSDLVEIAGEESYAEARERASAFYDSLLRQFRGQRVLLVAHGGPHQWLLERALHVDLKGNRRVGLDTGSFSRFRMSESGTQACSVNVGPSSIVHDGRMGAV